MLKRVRNASPDAASAKQEAEVAHKTVMAAAEQANRTRNEILAELKAIDEFLKAEHTQPKHIYELAEQVINITIPYKEKEIQELADKVRNISAFLN